MAQGPAVMEVMKMAKRNSLNFGYFYPIPLLADGVIDNDTLLLTPRNAKNNILPTIQIDSIEDTYSNLLRA
jgi:hypothetical protein